jgi:hypothetical protein
MVTATLQKLYRPLKVGKNLAHALWIVLLVVHERRDVVRLRANQVGSRSSKSLSRDTPLDVVRGAGLQTLDP